MKLRLAERFAKATPMAICAALGCLALFIYARMLGHEWLNWDDPWLVTNSELLHNFSWATLYRIFFDFSPETRLALGAEYLPLRDLSIMIDWQLWGDWSGGFLFVNLIYYIAAVVMFLHVLRQMEQDKNVIVLAAVLFAVQPVHVESVAWISSRKDVLCLLFSLASIYHFERYLKNDIRGQRSLLLSLVFYVCALMSKYIAIVVAAFISMRVLWCYWLNKAEGGSHRGLSYAQKLAPLFFFVIAAVDLWVAVRIGGTAGTLSTPISQSTWVNVLSQFDIFRGYVAKLWLPLNLSPVYYVDPIYNLASLRGCGVLVFVTSTLTVMALLLYRFTDPRLKSPQRVVCAKLLFWILWFFVALLPVSQIINIPNKIADRYLLLPSMSMAMLTALIVNEGVRYLKWRFGDGGSWPQKVWGSAGLYVVFLAFIAFVQVGYWQSSLSLWQRAVTLEPRESYAWYQLAVTYRDIQRPDKEYEALRVALKLHPTHEKALNNLAINRYHATGPTPEVFALYQRLLELNPKNHRGLQNFGYLLIEKGEYETAVNVLNQSLIVKPGYCKAMNNLGRAYLGLNSVRQAKHWFRMAVTCNPNLEKAQKNLRDLESQALPR